MTFFIGIDGGGTMTRMFVQRDDAEPEYLEVPLSLKIIKGDFVAAAKKLQQLLGQGEGVRDIRIAIGLAGMSRAEHQEAFKGAIHALPEFSDALVHIEGDATLALKSALGPADEGVLVIAGTGSVAYARSNDGTIDRVGGWGPETSDEGSGYWIGLRALRHYLRMIISGNQKDELFLAITKSLPKQVTSPREIANLLEREPLFPASLAPQVFECADRSEDAMGILREGAECLKAMIEEVSEKLTCPLSVYLSGSVAKQRIMVAELMKRLDAEGFQLLLLDDRAPSRKALEIARLL